MATQTQQDDITLDDLQKMLNAYELLTDFVQGQEDRLEEEAAQGLDDEEIDRIRDSLS